MTRRLLASALVLASAASTAVSPIAISAAQAQPGYDQPPPGYDQPPPPNYNQPPPPPNYGQGDNYPDQQPPG
ncbi:MAG: hypothetical protein JO303_18200, partial [Caulobacteraceae bacterium]|nr:hypothetical protein [Caulobacteraceae bacterium]